MDKTTQTWCNICDRDVGPALVDDICGDCWEAHADDLLAKGQLLAAKWARDNAHGQRKLAQALDLVERLRALAMTILVDDREWGALAMPERVERFIEQVQMLDGWLCSGLDPALTESAIRAAALALGVR